MIKAFRNVASSKLVVAHTQSLSTKFKSDTRGSLQLLDKALAKPRYYKVATKFISNDAYASRALGNQFLFIQLLKNYYRTEYLIIKYEFISREPLKSC